jgi:hypothetical protein
MTFTGASRTVVARHLNTVKLTAQIQNHGGEEEERVVSGLSALLLGICSIDNDDSVKDYSKYERHSPLLPPHSHFTTPLSPPSLISPYPLILTILAKPSFF